MRRMLGIVIVLAGLGCSLEDALKNAPCESDDDCLGDYTCVRTVHQEQGALPGWCREDGRCAAGQQIGCLAAGGECDPGLTATLEPGTGNQYCCTQDALGDSVIDISVDGTSARCVSCDPNLCSSMGDADEPCSEGEPRCVLVMDTCGCRVPDNEVENSECDDDQTCGEGFVCTRTLEQEEEPQETLDENKAIEPGWCRPEDAPECLGGVQEGCRAEDGCPGTISLSYICTDAGRCYCCGDPASSSFRVHVYQETSMGESAACVQCRLDDCDAPTTTCTLLEDPECIVSSGVCGCTPPA